MADQMMSSEGPHSMVSVGCCATSRVLAVPHEAVIRAMITGHGLETAVKQWGSRDNAAAAALKSTAGDLARNVLPVADRTDATDAWSHRIIPYNPFSLSAIRGRKKHFAAYMMWMMATSHPAHVHARTTLEHA